MASERDSRVDWEQVWQGTSEVEAEIVAGRLNAEGFRTMVRGHHMPQRSIVWLKGSFGVVVPAVSAETAREVLRSNGEGHNVIEPETGEGLTGQQKETLRFAIFGVMVVIGVTLVFAIREAL